MTEAVADRYGTGRSKRLDKRVGWTVAITAIVVGGTVIGFSGWNQQTTEYTNIGFTLNNDANETGVYSATTRFEVNTQPGVKVSCAVEALNTAKAVVGWKVIDLPVIESRSHNVSATLVTIGPATAIHAKACWEVD